MTKVEDFLQGFAENAQQNWLKHLVTEVVASRRKPRALVLDRIFTEFEKNNDLEPTRRPQQNGPTTAETEIATHPPGFSLTSLKHKSGVNALVEGAQIAFHPHLTVVFGKNGSGKSGFVRILKRLAGSRTQEEIWQNVRKTRSQNRCSAAVEYVLSGKELTCNWDGSAAVAPFTAMSVFDGKSVPVYLSNNLGFVYEPHGFDLFEATANALIDLQSRLAQDVRKKEAARPFMRFCNQDTSAGKFLAGVSANTSKEDVRKATTWTTADVLLLKNGVAQQAKLHNPVEQEELIASRSEKITRVEEVFGQIAADLAPNALTEFTALARKRAELKRKAKVKKGKSLDDYAIPEIESPEWEQFVEAGEAYIDISQSDRYPAQSDTCIYCLQNLSPNARQLLTLYRDLYRTQDASLLEKIEAKLKDAIDDLTPGPYRKEIPYARSALAKLLPEPAITDVLNAVAEADALAMQVREVLQGTGTHELKPLQLAKARTAIAVARRIVSAELKAFNETQQNLHKKARDIEKQLRELRDREKLSENGHAVMSFIEIENWLARARTANARLSTKPITDLGKRAWTALVSDAFRDAFKTESTHLNAPTVALAFRGEYGSQIRDKTVDGLEVVNEVFSEGEQKAVALADFLAEQSLRPLRAPLVFDDPATSFDHERKELIAKRIVALSASRQVVVFTHDLMFASYLHEEVEGDGNQLDSTRASFHDVRSEARNVGIVTRDYYPGAIKFEAAIKKIEAGLAGLSGLSGHELGDGLQALYGQLRRAVEKVVEERIFGRVISRWSDQIQMHNVAKATLDKQKLETAKKLHEKYSRYINAHNQSNEMIQHASADVATLRADIVDVKSLAVR